MPELIDTLYYTALTFIGAMLLQGGYIAGKDIAVMAGWRGAVVGGAAVAMFAVWGTVAWL